ncbi:MAG: hypothetical protein FJY29_03040 [Betaproteobacteria bacterium]|nr:hypothetical protein [Betaproteobacteria bacterium]
MRSGRGRSSFAALSSLLATTFLSMTPAALHAASKPKPEIPLGEETFEPTPAPKKATKVAPSASNKPEQAAPVKPKVAAENKSTEKPTPEKAAVEKTSPDKPANAAHDSNHTSDPHAAPPAEHGEPAAETSSHKGDEHSDAKDAHSETSPAEKKTSLLEGKVAPATPAKGSGFVWFGLIFVVLAIAIFIFT